MNTAASHAPAGYAPRAEAKIEPLALVCLAMPFLDVPWIAGSAYVRPLALPLALLLMGFRAAANPRSVMFPRDAMTGISLLFVAWAVVGATIMPGLSEAAESLKGVSLGGRVVRDVVAILLGFGFWMA